MSTSGKQKLVTSQDDYRAPTAWDAGFNCVLDRELPDYLDAELNGTNDPEWLIGFAKGAIAGEQVRQGRHEWLLEVAEAMVDALRKDGKERLAGLEKAVGCHEEMALSLQAALARERCE